MLQTIFYGFCYLFLYLLSVPITAVRGVDGPGAETNQDPKEYP